MAASVNVTAGVDPNADPETLRAQLTDAVRVLLAAYPVGQTEDAVLRGARFDAGLAFVHFPVGRGGLGLDPALQPFVEGLFLAAGCVDWRYRNVIGLGMAAPTVLLHGSAALQDRLLRPLFTGEEVWCQLFSEPGAGSDLAGLSTRAVRDGDEWVVDGQKVWTTLAHVARWGLLLARTDPEQPKHRGLTYFVCDMTAPGVDVRPLRQLTGEAEFNEVYLTEVRIPDGHRLGEVGGGWRVAVTTLMNERVALGGGVGERGAGAIGQAVAAYRDAVAAGRAGPVERDRLVKLWARAEAARLTNLRAAQTREGGAPGPDGSIGKLQMAELNQAVYDLCMDLIGEQALLVAGYDETRPSAAGLHADVDLRKAYLRAFANSIEGGTSEVMRNVLGERVLGLPGEPRLDKDLPWSQVPRS